MGKVPTDWIGDEGNHRGEGRGEGGGGAAKPLLNVGSVGIRFVT